MLKWEGPLDAVTDQRKEARIPTRRILRSLVVMFLCRLGSLNALSLTRGRSFWRSWLGGRLPSADTLGRVAALMDLQAVRAVNHHLYDRLKRNKALPPPSHGLMLAIVDGHETHASFKRCCEQCLQRTIHTKNGDRIQYYHRMVAVSLVSRDLTVILDAEPMRKGEDEVAAALRLLEQVLREYPRAFDVVLGDALYCDSRFFNFLYSRGKHALAVLKQESRDLYKDAQEVFLLLRPTRHNIRGHSCTCWDSEGFTTWPQVKAPVRVVRSEELWQVRRQRDKKPETLTSTWYWATTLPARQIDTPAAVSIGHARWDIENKGFNDLVNNWKADHVYRHEPTAILVLWLLAMICLNLFAAFFRRNLKAALRKTVTMLHVGRQITAELYAGPARAPM